MAAEEHYAIEGAPVPTCSCGKEYEKEGWLESHIQGKARAAAGETGAKANAPAGAGTKAGQPAWAKSLQEDLTGLLVEAGGYLSLPLPFTGFYWVMNAPVRARALVTLAERDEKIRKALEKMVKASVVATIAGALVDTGMTVGVDMDRLAPDALPLQLRGITQAYEEYEAIAEQEERRGGEETGSPGGPGSGGLLAELSQASA